jgi:hypothetical protein
MDNGNTHSTFVVAAAVVVSQLMATYNIIFDDVPTKFEQRMRKRREHELTPYKRNLSVQYGPPTTELVPQPVLDRLLLDEIRHSMYKVIHLHTWQFMVLADRLKDLIERPRVRSDGTRPVKAGPEVKHDYSHHLFRVLRVAE